MAAMPRLIVPSLALAALLLLLGGVPAPASGAEERSERANELLAQARAHFGQGRYGMAAESARRVVALGAPRDAVAYASNLLGLALYRHWSFGLEDASEEKLKRLVVRLGGSFLPEPPGEEILVEASEAFRRAVELDPVGANSVRHNLAQTLYELGRDEEAAEVIAEYIERGGDHPDALALHACLDRSAGQAAAEPLRVGPPVSRPEKISGGNPIYTDLGRFFNLQGIVILEAIIDEAGDVRCVRPLKRLPLGLTEAAVNSVRAWKFKPATVEGKPVEVFYTLTVNFAIDRRLGPG